MKNFPEKLNMAALPTKIEKLDKVSEKLGKNIFIKRDDQTGMEISGNKVRKLEYTVKEALDNGCNTLITCGGIQSNHARATAAIGKKYGLNVILALNSNNQNPEKKGNYLMDLILGADCRFIPSKDFENINEIMKNIAKDEEQFGKKSYIMPVGASCGMGNFGYINAIKEIEEQEKAMGVTFDAIVCTVGSGGTYSGLYLGNEYFGLGKDIIGVNICDDKEYFVKEIKKIIDESKEICSDLQKVSTDNIIIKDGYISGGYAINEPEDFAIIREFAKDEGIILDPVYTGKAMKGLISEIKKGSMDKYNNILFIHTGGLFGLFAKAEEIFAE